MGSAWIATMLTVPQTRTTSVTARTARGLPVTSNATSTPVPSVQASTNLATSAPGRELDVKATKTEKHAAREAFFSRGQACMRASSLGKRDEAIEQFKLIYEVDIGYKDVAAKVDAYYSGQG